MNMDWLYGPESQRGRDFDMDAAMQLVSMMRRHLKPHPRFTVDFQVPNGNGGWDVVADSTVPKLSDANLKRVHLRGLNSYDPSLASSPPPDAPIDQDALGIVDLDIATGSVHIGGNALVAREVTLIANEIGPYLADEPPRINPAALRRSLAVLAVRGLPWVAWLALAGLWLWTVLTVSLPVAVVSLGTLILAIVAVIAFALSRRRNVLASWPHPGQMGHRLLRLTRADRARRRGRVIAYFLGIASGVVIVVIGGLVLAAFGVGVPLAP